MPVKTPRGKKVVGAVAAAFIGAGALSLSGCHSVKVSPSEMLKYKFATPAGKAAMEKELLHRAVFGEPVPHVEPVKKPSFVSTGQWPGLLKTLNWNPDHPTYARVIVSLEGISRKAGVSPAEAVFAINTRGISRSHANTLKNELFFVKRQLRSAKGNGRSSLMAQQARLGADIRVIEAIVSEKAVSKAKKREVTELVTSVKGQLFIRKGLEKIIASEK